MVTINIYEAKTNLSRLIERVEAGESITIARAGKPVADLVPHRRTDIVFGTLKVDFVYDDETFDDEDEEINKMFGTA